MNNSDQLLDIQVKTMQNYIPQKIRWRGKERELSKKENLATGRAIWFIIKKGYGISSASSRASGSFNVVPGKIEKAIRQVFPQDYFTHFQKSKNTQTIKELK